MARLRPGRTCRNPNSQSWSRFSLRKPKKNYVRALPHTSLLVFNSGADKTTFDMTGKLYPLQPIQLRSNAIESARLSALHHLEAAIPGQYYLKVLVFPHNVIREHKMAAGAGADRISRGMSLAFGRPVSVAARLRESQPLFMIKTMKANRSVIAEAFKRAGSKLSGKYKLVVS